MAPRSPVTANIRKPTVGEATKMAQAQKLTRSGMDAKNDMMTKLSPTARAAAEKDVKVGLAMREKVPAPAREYDAYQNAGFKKGGGVKKMARGGGIEQRGKTRGRFV